MNALQREKNCMLEEKCKIAVSYGSVIKKTATEDTFLSSVDKLAINASKKLVY